MKTKSPLLNLPWTLLLLTIVLPRVSNAQNALDDYIREGLKNNVVLQQKNLSWQQAQQSLQIAKRPRKG
jgi:hypothetical protein